MEKQNAVEIPGWLGVVLISIFLSIILAVLILNLMEKAQNVGKDFTQQVVLLDNNAMTVGNFCDSMPNRYDVEKDVVRLNEKIKDKCDGNYVHRSFLKSADGKCYQRICERKGSTTITF